MVKLDKKIQTIKVNRDALPALNSNTCFTLGISEGKQ